MKTLNLVFMILFSALHCKDNGVSTFLIKFGRCIIKNDDGKKIRVFLERVNEKSGLVQNNENALWPVRYNPPLHMKVKKYEYFRLNLGTITRIKQKTKLGFDPIVMSEEDNTNFEFYIPFKYGFENNISSFKDFFDVNQNLRTELFLGKKMIYFYKYSGRISKIRCTILNPNVKPYHGYRFAPKFTTLSYHPVHFAKRDYTISKEIILTDEIHPLQLKFDGKGEFDPEYIKKQQEKKELNKKKALEKKKRDQEQMKNGLKPEAQSDKKKKKKTRKGPKGKKKQLKTDKNKLIQNYDVSGSDINKNPVKEELIKKKEPKTITDNDKPNDVKTDPILDQFKNQIGKPKEAQKNTGEHMDIRIHEEELTREEEFDSTQKKDQEDVSEEESFKSDIEFKFKKKVENNRKYSINSSLERLKKQREEEERMLTQVHNITIQERSLLQVDLTRGLMVI